MGVVAFDVVAVGKFEQRVGGGVHDGGPEVVAHLEMVLDCESCHGERAQLVFVAVESEHVAHPQGTSVECGVEGGG